VDYITQLIQTVVWTSTPNRENTLQDAHNLPLHIRELIYEKRRARRRWQNSRNSLHKTELNKLTHNLRSAITKAKNETVKLTLLTYHRTTTHYGKPQRNLPTIAITPIRKQDRSWARTNKEKTNLFADYLATVFTPNNKNNNNEGDVETFLKASGQLSLPIGAFTQTEVHNIINLLNPHKAPGYDIITGALLKKLPSNENSANKL
jgi:hypothetical protein